MMLRIVHRTGYRYTGQASASYNEARMTPRTTMAQQVLHTRVEISPPAWAHTYTDYWGTTVTAFEVHEPHERLTVTASATVNVQRPPVEGLNISWEDIRSESSRATHSEFLSLSPQVEPPEDLLATVREIADTAGTPADAAMSIMHLIHNDMKYLKGATGVHTQAAEAWAARSGVCQDISNLAIGCLRAVGIPASYVSGYLLPAREPEVGTSYIGESHAWVRFWDGDWVGYDPTNETKPEDRHVEVAMGREYGDVPPLRGIFTGTGTSAMFVEVELTRLN